jgi:hypothetical protein
MMIGLVLCVVGIVKFRDGIIAELDELPQTERTATLIAIGILFIFGWPAMLASMKNE